MPSDNNPYNLTFPYPVKGSVTRPRGQGCTSCVHKTYCPAIYWKRLEYITFFELDAGAGTKCASWSSNPEDIVKTVSQSDMDHANYIADQYGGVEADRCPLEATSGNSRM